MAAREAQVIKGICRQIDWCVGKRLEDLKKEWLSAVSFQLSVNTELRPN